MSTRCRGSDASLSQRSLRVRLLRFVGEVENDFAARSCVLHWEWLAAGKNAPRARRARTHAFQLGREWPRRTPQRKAVSDLIRNPRFAAELTLLFRCMLRFRGNRESIDCEEQPILAEREDAARRSMNVRSTH